MDPLSNDPRVLALELGRMVLSVHDAGKTNRGASLTGAAGLSILVAAALFFFFRPHVSIFAAALVFIGLFVSAAVFQYTETVLVALADENLLFFERKSVFGRVRSREVVGQLSDLIVFDTPSVIDTETNPLPYEVHFVRVYLGEANGISVWQTDTKEKAVAAGVELLRLASIAKERKWSDSPTPA